MPMQMKGKGRAGLNPDIRVFQEVGAGILRVTGIEHVEGMLAGWFRRGHRALFGQPLATVEEPLQRLSKLKALPILASDNISSSAYATEEIMRVLVVAGAGVLTITLPITVALIGVLVVVVSSYWQVIRAYPTGGGSYLVAKENLGRIPALVAAASLIVDYILTVAVSVVAGVEALTSVAPELFPYRVLISLGTIAVLVIGNLRGVRESGNMFSVPTYFYVFSLLSLVAFGLVRMATGTLPSYSPPAGWLPATATPLGFILLLRAFSSGAVALTGVEAVSNGMRILKPPESRNAQFVLLGMAVFFGSLFLGISILSSHIGLIPDPSEKETIISQLARVLGGGGVYHLLIQIATALILILAANTAFVDFPRLSAVLASDRFFPKQFLFRGHRLALLTGILVVGVLAGAFIVVFNGSVSALIPLYTVGVFIAFTLSQVGMVRYWLRTREHGWRLAMAFNGLGAVVTGFVAVESTTVKFTHGAWVVFLMIPALIFVMRAIYRHYERLSQQLRLEHPMDLPKVTRPQTVLVPVADINKAVAAALAYARSLSPNVRAVHISTDLADAERLRKRWNTWAQDIPLVIIESPYRNWTGPLLHFTDALSRETEDAPLTVVVPEFIPKRWWQHLLHSQGAFRLKAGLLSKPNVVVVDIPYHLEN